MTRAMNLRGNRYGRWAVLDQPPERINGRTHWRCLCECGVERLVQRQNLTSGKSVSCGCYNKERIISTKTTHGGASSKHQHPLYKIWAGVLDRCRRPESTSYPNYGGRGISVCPRWIGRDGFPNFLADMGPRPSPEHSIDRIDNDGNYEPGNCRWATRVEQAANTRVRKDSVGLVVEGMRMSVAAAALKYGVKDFTIYDRLRRGLPGDEAVASGRQMVRR